MNWKQVVAGIFSIIAIFIYLQQEPKLTVSSVYSNIVNLYYVNEKQEVYVVEKDFVCTNTVDCILKSCVYMNVKIEDVVLEEGVLIVDIDKEIQLTKFREAFLWYLLQFDDVEKIKLYVDDKLWDSGLLFDGNQVFSSNFESFTSDLYMSMPLVIYENIDGYEIVRTVRIPYEDRVDRLVNWILYVYGESAGLVKDCVIEDDVLIVSLNGKLNDYSHIKSLASSLLLRVDDVVIFHDAVKVFGK